jgi:RNA polymerase sigma-70 factor, ECF subfamily
MGGILSLTNVLKQVSTGDPKAWTALVQLLYTDLRRVAAAQLRAEPPGQTLQPTELVHEAYLRLSEYRKKDWQNRAHFCAAAAAVMRHVLVERARRRRSRGKLICVEIDESCASPPDLAVDLIDLDRALKELARIDERLCHIVVMRYFGGLTVEDVAEVLDISSKTVNRDWAVARAFLLGRIHPQ